MDQAVEIKELKVALAARDADLAACRARIAELEAKVAMLLEALERNSNNSNKPPSSDPPDVKIAKRKVRRRKDKQKRKRGAQKGHSGSHRALVAAEFVDEVVDVYPPECESCCGEATSFVTISFWSSPGEMVRDQTPHGPRPRPRPHTREDARERACRSSAPATLSSA